MKQSRLAYPLPDVIDPIETICVRFEIPDDIYHRGAFLGAMYTLTRWFNWESDEAKTGKQVADVWLKIYRDLEENLGETPCDDRTPLMLQQNPENPCQVQYMNDFGEWVTFYDFALCGAFNNNIDILGILNYSETNIANGITAQELVDFLADEANYDAQLAINAQNQANRDKLLCYALRIMFEVYLETMKNNLESARKGEITLSMVAGAFIALGFAPLSPLITGAILASFTAGALFGVGAVNYSDLTDQTARDKVICHAYESLFGDNLTRAGFATVYDVVPFVTDSPEYRQSQALKDLIGTSQAYIALLNMMQNKLSVVDAMVNDCDECISPTIWVHTFDFAVDNGNFYAIEVTANNPDYFGVWSSGKWGSTDGLFGGRYRRAIWFARDFAESTVTKVQIYTNFTKGIFDQNINTHLFQSSSGTNYATTIRASIIASVATDATDYMEWNGTASMRRIAFQMASSHRFTAQYSGVMEITKIIVSGTGVNPFI